VKVADFGIVLAIERATWLTGLGRPIGTPAYMSPEQCKGERVAAASDVYSVGVTMFELATGQLPFTEQAGSPFALMLKHIRHRPPDPRQYRPDLPAWFARVLLRCLEKDPARRYADGQALAAAIEGGPQAEDPGEIETEEPRTASRLDMVAIREQLKRLPQRAIVAWACRYARRTLGFNHDPRLLQSIESAEATLKDAGTPGSPASLSPALLRIRQLRSASFNVVDAATSAPSEVAPYGLTSSGSATPDTVPPCDSAAQAALAAAATCACAAARCAADAAADAAYVADKALSAHAAAGRSVSEVWKAAQRDYQKLLAANLGPEGTIGGPIPTDFWT
jgi:serine/threonine protein kinase